MRKIGGTDETIQNIKANPIRGLDDREFDFIASKCNICIHFDDNENIASNAHKCSAFDDTPLEIWKEEVEHDKPYPNDKGFRFTQKPGTRLS